MKYVIGFITCWMLIVTSVVVVQHKEIQVLRVINQNYEVEHRFHGRKMEELHARHEQLQCQYDIAVAGFRGGHWQAIRLYREGAFESCELPGEYTVASFGPHNKGQASKQPHQ